MNFNNIRSVSYYTYVCAHAPTMIHLDVRLCLPRYVLEDELSANLSAMCTSSNARQSENFFARGLLPCLLTRLLLGHAHTHGTRNSTVHHVFSAVHVQSSVSLKPLVVRRLQGMYLWATSRRG